MFMRTCGAERLMSSVSIVSQLIFISNRNKEECKPERTKQQQTPQKTTDIIRNESASQKHVNF